MRKPSLTPAMTEKLLFIAEINSALRPWRPSFGPSLRTTEALARRGLVELAGDGNGHGWWLTDAGRREVARLGAAARKAQSHS